jgi:hypothetical protein
MRDLLAHGYAQARMSFAGAFACNHGFAAGVEHFTETHKVGDNASIRLVAALRYGWVY